MLRQRQVWEFRHGDEWRILRDPHGPASPRQLAWLERNGLPAVGEFGRPLTKLEASRAIDAATEQEAAA